MAKRHEQLAGNVGAETSVRAAIRALRQQRDVSQSKLAVLLGVTDTTIARWEMGLHKPTPPQLIVMLLLARPPAQELFEQLTGKKKVQLLSDLDLRARESMFATEAAEQADSAAFKPIHVDSSAAAFDPYDELFSRLRQIIDSGQSQLIGQAEELIFRLADKAQFMSRKRKERKG